MTVEYPEVPPLDDQNPLFGGELIDDPIVPDHTASRDDKDKKKEKSGPGLGESRTKTGTVPKLTRQDRDKISTFYTAMAFGLAPFNNNAALACADSAEKCADAWLELANQNVRVRKLILGMMEGGAWGLVIGAHMPILLAITPDHVKQRVPFLPQFDVEDETEE